METMNVADSTILPVSKACILQEMDAEEMKTQVQNHRQGRRCDQCFWSPHPFTAEVENAINQHSNVVESAVVGYPHDIKGQGIYAYVITQFPITDEEHFRNEVLMVVTKRLVPLQNLTGFRW